MNKIDPEETTKTLVAFIRKAFSDAGFSRAVIGVSGGVDSATSGLLVIRSLGTGNVYPVLMPYGALSTQETLDAMSFVQSAGVPVANISRIDIKPALELLAKAAGGVPDNVRRGNMMARVRMICLFDQAKRRQALVVGTENRSEHLLGYFTRFGDEASDIEPLRNVYKTQVYELAKYLGVPEAILTKPPSAGLWPEQTDEGELGFTYRQADEILFLATEQKQDAAQIIAAGHPEPVVTRVLARMRQNAFKHRLPYIPA